MRRTPGPGRAARAWRCATGNMGSTAAREHGEHVWSCPPGPGAPPSTTGPAAVGAAAPPAHRPRFPRPPRPQAGVAECPPASALVPGSPPPSGVPDALPWRRPPLQGPGRRGPVRNRAPPRPKHPARPARRGHRPGSPSAPPASALATGSRAPSIPSPRPSLRRAGGSSQGEQCIMITKPRPGFRRAGGSSRIRPGTARRCPPQGLPRRRFPQRAPCAPSARGPGSRTPQPCRCSRMRAGRPAPRAPPRRPRPAVKNYKKVNSVISSSFALPRGNPDSTDARH